mmetsp:Transcript_8299/g.20906  ORF Transcript_8299/g.20906 Transcript_8299/m.20906 type:complete len:404 (-) Transcript_8299:674-1885(-)|eukprot:CAMPEP_0177682912 /NCGR_PEP_ID=MMETSP0447-20121125/31506_1 /TAXON_ID=0 /ORGANISM="Stygamoeba regulata, Strain BSH-02190019" /LENGTH=403 /DNA_ID=CAMNT_0019192435 /DNA_START=145 /DNA_END=1356 /DNA_ORIENTATION=+
MSSLLQRAQERLSRLSDQLFGDESDDEYSVEDHRHQLLQQHAVSDDETEYGYRDDDSSGSDGGASPAMLLRLQRIQSEMDSLRESILRQGVVSSGSRSRSAWRGAGSLHPKRDPWLKPWLVNNTLWITMVWQVLNLMLLAITGGYDSTPSVASNIAIGIMTVFQLLNILFVLIVSVKLVKQLVHRTASGWFLAQSYLSTMLLFGGIYHLLFRIASSSFDGILEEVQAQTTSPFGMLLLVAVRCWYFSITAVTTTGFGDIVATRWYSQVVVSLQMLLSTLYSTVIFAKGLTHFSSSSPSSGRNHRPDRLSSEPSLQSFPLSPRRDSHRSVLPLSDEEQPDSNHGDSDDHRPVQQPQLFEVIGVHSSVNTSFPRGILRDPPSSSADQENSSEKQPALLSDLFDEL